jgi:hypothetical protein
MATKTPNALSREHRAVWWDAYLAALPVVVGNNGNLVDRSAKRLAELAAEMAREALDQYVLAAKGERRITNPVPPPRHP